MVGAQESYEDRVLLKLRRKYTKDEVIQALNRKVEELELEKGQLLSEIDHLNYTSKELKLSVGKDISELVRESALYRDQQKILKERGVLIRELYRKLNENNK